MNRKVSQIQFRIDSDLKMTLEREAIAEGKTLSDYLRERLFELKGGEEMQKTDAEDRAVQLIAQLRRCRVNKTKA